MNASNSTPDKKQAAYLLGHEAETKAAQYLEAQNFRILETRFRTKYGEIDLIARQDDLILIVEVKARSTLEQAMNAVSRTAMKRIEGASDIWLAEQPDYHLLSLRYDLIAMLADGTIHHTEALFTADG